jgi:predicted PurR-regulated permease PerM
VNGAFGVVIGIGLWLIGIPSAILWGILAAALRFVPYIGAVIAAAFPLALAVAIDPGWSMLLWVRLAGAFLVVEPVVGHVIERWSTSQYRAFAGCCRCVGDVLDRAMGAYWALCLPHH